MSPASVPPTTDSDVDDLAAAFSCADDPARRAELLERIVHLTLPLADSIARRYAGRGIETDDLIQVARAGLVLAVHRYRPGMGSCFAAFATPTVTGEVKRWFRDQGWSVRPPRRVQELRSRISTEEERMRHLFLRDPRPDELAALLEVTVNDVAEARLCSAGYRAASLDGLTATGTRLVDHALVTPCPTEALTQADALRWAVARLPERQQAILRLRYVEELTQAQIAERIGVSQMQVSRLLRVILDQLRRDIDSDGAVARSGRPGRGPRAARPGPALVGGVGRPAGCKPHNGRARP